MAGDQNTTTSIIGTTADYAAVRSETMWQGSFLTGPEVEQRPAGGSPRLVHGRRPRPWRRVPSAPTITIGGIPFRVVGILQSKGGSGFLNEDDKVLIPVGAVQRHFVGGDSVRSIGVSVASADEIDLVKALHHDDRSRRAMASPG